MAVCWSYHPTVTLTITAFHPFVKHLGEVLTPKKMADSQQFAQTRPKRAHHRFSDRFHALRDSISARLKTGREVFKAGKTRRHTKYAVRRRLPPGPFDLVQTASSGPDTSGQNPPRSSGAGPSPAGPAPRPGPAPPRRWRYGIPGCAAGSPVCRKSGRGCRRSCC